MAIMPTVMPIQEHIAVLAAEGARFTALAARLDAETPVPTCPEWTVRDLIAHQGEVHRWATDLIRGRWDGMSPADQADRVAAPLGPVLIGWFTDGVHDLIDALKNAPDNLQSMVFLLDAPPPRHFWARRQANETRMHRIDALSAELGRKPVAAETDITTAEAIDGIDELLNGFIPRKRTNLRSAEPFTIAIEPNDIDRRWVLAVSDDPVVTTETDAPADATFGGSATEVYLGLWNRGTEMTATGRPGALEQWREQVRVSWQ